MIVNIEPLLVRIGFLAEYSSLNKAKDQKESMIKRFRDRL